MNRLGICEGGVLSVQSSHLCAGLGKEERRQSALGSRETRAERIQFLLGQGEKEVIKKPSWERYRLSWKK